jgi:haloalkane dehalogenase
MLAVREQLTRWEKPALVLFGDSDPIFSTRSAERLAELIPGALPPETLAGAGHLVQEDRGEEIGERVVRFLTSDR